MSLLRNEVKVYSFREFSLIQQNNELVEEMNRLDKAIGHIKRNKNKYMVLVAILALTFDFSTIVSFASDEVSTAAIDKAGMTILGLIRKVGYWVGIILCCKDVIKHSMRGHLDSVGSIVAMYGMGYGVLYFLPWLFDLIKGIF